MTALRKAQFPASHRDDISSLRSALHRGKRPLRALSGSAVPSRCPLMSERRRRIRSMTAGKSTSTPSGTLTPNSPAPRTSAAALEDRMTALEGDTADVETVASHEPPLHQGDAGTHAGGSRRRHEAGGAAADDDDVVSSPPVRDWSSPPGERCQPALCWTHPWEVLPALCSWIASSRLPESPTCLTGSAFGPPLPEK